jgi:hypothetical protein
LPVSFGWAVSGLSVGSQRGPGYLCRNALGSCAEVPHVRIDGRSSRDGAGLSD